MKEFFKNIRFCIDYLSMGHNKFCKTLFVRGGSFVVGFTLIEVIIIWLDTGKIDIAYQAGIDVILPLGKIVFLLLFFLVLFIPVIGRIAFLRRELICNDYKWSQVSELNAGETYQKWSKD